MTDGSVSNTYSPSTQWRWKRVKITRAPQAGQSSAPKGHRWRGWPKRDPAHWLGISIRRTGGPEDWWKVRARGRDQAYPGWMTLSDVFHDINQTH